MKFIKNKYITYIGAMIGTVLFFLMLSELLKSIGIENTLLEMMMVNAMFVIIDILFHKMARWLWRTDFEANLGKVIFIYFIIFIGMIGLVACNFVIFYGTT